MFEMFKNFGAEKKKDVLKESLEAKNETEKVESLKELGALAYQKLLTKVPELLSEEDNMEFESIVGDQEKMMSFLKEKLANFDALVDESIKETQEKVSDDLIEEISENDKETIFKLGSIPLQNVLAEAFTILEEGDQDHLGKLLEAGEEKPLFNFLEEKLPNFKELLEKETDNTASRMEAILKKAKERAAQ
ncbi:hypothetical protein JXK06_02420 [Patescibacteria group bacterium]|nr:hypothetical protein [Patescibacteria group bacterium]